ncbi:hypothetical protein B0H14DRAFT_2581816 [Mycena olivaceomarginata]|nr:hypothetical protein B0H14DRAFT_2581816 [Mycena olivaceomarginata]
MVWTLCANAPAALMLLTECYGHPTSDAMQQRRSLLANMNRTPSPLREVRDLDFVQCKRSAPEILHNESDSTRVRIGARRPSEHRASVLQARSVADTHRAAAAVTVWQKSRRERECAKESRITTEGVCVCRPRDDLTHKVCRVDIPFGCGVVAAGKRRVGSMSLESAAAGGRPNQWEREDVSVLQLSSLADPSIWVSCRAPPGVLPIIGTLVSKEHIPLGSLPIRLPFNHFI